ncbi:QRIC2 protein, partial [Certhia familiaris]|nr:QRIC2 protein [Certhia familiaris]
QDSAKQPCRGNPALVPISLARVMRQERKRELQKMEEKQEMRNAMLEQLVTDTANKLNEQLGDTGSLQLELGQGSADCSSCTFNIRVYLGMLLQRCEKLQEQVDSLESHQMAVGKLEKMMGNWGQNQKWLHNVEAKVVHIQGDCEKLSFISGSLQKDSQQNQKSIEV